MKELFVDYPTALELKNKGFDEPCLGFYHNWKYETLMPTIENNEFSTGICHNSGKHNMPILAAPLYQQAIRWCMKKIDGVDDGSLRWFTSITIHEDGSGYWSFTGEDRTSFNDLGDAIKEALKRIK